MWTMDEDVDDEVAPPVAATRLDEIEDGKEEVLTYNDTAYSNLFADQKVEDIKKIGGSSINSFPFFKDSKGNKITRSTSLTSSIFTNLHTTTDLSTGISMNGQPITRIQSEQIINTSETPKPTTSHSIMDVFKICAIKSPNQS